MACQSSGKEDVNSKLLDSSMQFSPETVVAAQVGMQNVVEKIYREVVLV